MTTELNLPINSLDYPDIRENFIKFLKEQIGPDGVPVYEDYNFQASGISTLLNLLAYNTHYIGYYVKMLLNESFIDSAVKKESLYSKAKMTGYVPRGYTAARIDVSLEIYMDLTNPDHYEPLSRAILIPKGTSFSGQNAESDQRIFFVIDDVFITDVSYPNATTAHYKSGPITIYEGRWQEWKFKVDTTLLNQRYVIKDKFIDIDTLRVSVIPDGHVVGEVYKLASGTDVFDVDENSSVYYLSTQEDGNFEIVFSNGVFGKTPPHNATVLTHYISTKGDSGNGCKRFAFNAPSQDIPTELNIGNWEDFVVQVTPGDASSGGVNPETEDSMRFTIPHHYRRQNRIVTKDDFKAIIISEFRNIDSISVWGGEDNIFKDYGKIYISVKPKFADKLTLTTKRDIEKRLISKYCVVGMQPVFVDPEYVNVELIVYGKIETRKTNLTVGQIDKMIVNTILNYNKTSLNVFDNFLSDVVLMNQIKVDVPSLKSVYSKKTFNKDQQIIYKAEIENSLFIGNPITHGVKSSLFIYGDDICYFSDDVDGRVYIYKSVDNLKLLLKSFGWVDYDRGIIYYEFPKFATLVKNNFGEMGVINFSATPVNPDVETHLQNIVRITDIKVVLSNA
jgi:hypothetical protein